MMGSDSSGSGILPLAVIDLFAKIEKNHDRQVKVTVSFLEVYNETIRDLLVDPPHHYTDEDMEKSATSKDRKTKVCNFVTNLINIFTGTSS
jgi:hypothetical protein